MPLTTISKEVGKLSSRNEFPLAERRKTEPNFTYNLFVSPLLFAKNTAQAGVTNPPAISTHSGIQLPSLPSTSTISVSHLHLQPTPFSFSVSHLAQ